MPPSRDSRLLLDQLLNASDDGTPAQPTSAPPPPRAQAQDPPERLTVKLPTSLVERCRTAVYYTPGLTLVRLAAAALTQELERLEREHGQPFPARRGPLRTGRPVRQ